MLKHAAREGGLAVVCIALSVAVGVGMGFGLMLLGMKLHASAGWAGTVVAVYAAPVACILGAVFILGTRQDMRDLGSALRGVKVNATPLPESRAMVAKMMATVAVLAVVATRISIYL